jgi:hypothetical protein
VSSVVITSVDKTPVAQDGTAVELDHRLAYEPVDVNGRPIGAANARVGAEGEVNRPLRLLVLEDDPGDRGARIRADPQLGDRPPVLAAGTECP